MSHDRTGNEKLMEMPTERLDKELGLADVYAISTGAMFSSGFFLLPGLAAAQTGPSAPLAYLAAGFFILPALFSVAELSTAMPRAGGAYYFLDRSLGPLVGTVGGLGTWLALILKSAFALVGMGAYLAIYADVPVKPLAVALTLVFMVVNIVGARETSRLQRVLVGVLLAILAFFVVQGLVEVGSRGFIAVTTERFTPFMPFGLSGFMSTVGLVFVSYAGLTKVASVSEEVRDPDRNIPLGMMLSLATASFVYTVGVYIIVAVLPPDELRSDLTPVATAAQAFFDWLPGGAGVLMIVIAAIAAFASTGNAGIMSASRYPLAMARDRLVSSRFAVLGRFHTPTFAIVVTSGLMIAAIMLLRIESIAKLASAFQLLLFSILNLAVIIMRESRIEGYDPGYRSPLYPWMQIFGLLAPIWLIAEMGALAGLFTLALVGITIGWYFYYTRGDLERSGAIFHTFARLGERRHAGLDIELRAIVREKGLRDDDPFDEVVARAQVMDVAEVTDLSHLIERAAHVLSERTGHDATIIYERLEAETLAGFIPIGSGVAMPHLRVVGLERPHLLLVRCSGGVRLPDSPGLQAVDEAISAVFFLLSPQEEPGQHLRLLGHLATRIEDDHFSEQWLAASDEHELRDIMLRDERTISIRLHAAGKAGDWIGLTIRELELPEGTLVALVRRGKERLVPGGSTVLNEGDYLTVIGTTDTIRLLREQRTGRA